MKILVAAATYLEVKPFLNHLGFSKEESFYSYATDRFNTLDVLITGVGMVSTTYQITKQLSKVHYHLVINAGIAGAFSPKLLIGDAVIVSSDCLAEMGAESPNGLVPFDKMAYRGIYQAKAKSNFTIKAWEHLPRVNGITVNKVHGKADSIVEVEIHFSPEVESMEGAAVLAICEAEKIDCYQLRTISNRVEPRNTANWNIGLAIQNLNLFLTDLLNEI
jgi:futalosine hydrolase